MQHPEIFRSPIKEPNFFNTDIFVDDVASQYRLDTVYPTPRHHAMIRDETTYLKLYSNAVGLKAIGDYSVHYLRSKAAATAIHRKVPAAKIIICLRDPVERAYSHFLMDNRIGRVKTPFRRIVEHQIREPDEKRLDYHNYIDPGLYYDQVKTYTEVFGREAILLILHDDLEKDFYGNITKVWRHLGVQQTTSFKTVRENPSSVAKFSGLNRFLYNMGVKRAISKHVPSRLKKMAVKHYYRDASVREIDPRDRAILKDFFKQDVRKLSAFIGRNLDHWL